MANSSTLVDREQSLALKEEEIKQLKNAIYSKVVDKKALLEQINS